MNRSPFRFLLPILALGLAQWAGASLRVRFCDPYGVMKASSDTVKNNAVWWDSIMAGAWDGYDAANGFDNATDLGSFPHKKYVTTSFWVDSIAEPRSDFPFIQNADTAVAGDGVFVLLFGQLKVDEEADYTFYSSVSDEGLYTFLDINQDGQIARDGSGYSANPYYGSTESLADRNTASVAITSAWPSAPSPQDFTHVRQRTVHLKAGKYRIMAFQWDATEICWAALFWKKGNGPIVPIPASAFGKRRQLGKPVAHLSKVEVGGQALTTTFAQIDPCTAVTFYADTANMLGQPVAGYVWSFGDSTEQTTTENHVTYTYKKSGVLFPSVRVKRGTEVSFPSTETYLMSVAASCKGDAIVAGARGPGAIAARGAVVSIPNPGDAPVRLEAFALNGGMARTVSARSRGGMAVADLGALPRGSYMVRVFRSGSKVQAFGFIR